MDYELFKSDPLTDASKAENSNKQLSPEQISTLEFVPHKKFKDFLAPMETADLLVVLDRCWSGIEAKGGVATAYTGLFRKQYIASNILLTERVAEAAAGSPAPAFRPRLKASNEPVDYARDLSNDAQVLDLFYFWTMGHRRCANDHGAAALSGDSFDFDAALRFARTAGSTMKKLKMLGLDDKPGIRLCRFGAAVLKSKGDSAVHRTLQQYRLKVEAAQETMRVRANVDPELWIDLVVADLALNKLGLASDGENLQQMILLLSGRASSRADTLPAKLRKAKARFSC